jgi:hypothetical protein
MPRTINRLEAVATIGIDIGKNTFHVVALDRNGAIVLRQKLSRRQVEARLANMPPRVGGASEVRSMPPAIGGPFKTQVSCKLSTSRNHHQLLGRQARLLLNLDGPRAGARIASRCGCEPDEIDYEIEFGRLLDGCSWLHRTRTGLRGWACRTRTQKCRRRLASPGPRRGSRLFL